MSTDHDTASADHDHPPLPPDIHLVIDGQDVGPLDAPDVLRLASEGRIGPATFAWHPALDDWQEAANLPELAWIFEPAKEPEVSTPEPALADFLPRFGAGLVDVIVLLSLRLLAAWAFGYWPVLSGQVDDAASVSRFNLLAQLVAAVYFIVPMSRIGGGATPGYWLFGLKLVDQTGLAAPGLLRTLFWYIVSYVRLVGWITYFFDAKRRMLHNIASHTIVITASPVRDRPQDRR